MSASRLDAARAAATRLGLDARTLEALDAHARAEAQSEPRARMHVRLADALEHRPVPDAIDEVRGALLASGLSTTEQRTFALVLALGQVPRAEARHAALGVSPEVSRATLGDLGVWVRHFRAQIGIEGITVEILDWAQHYLRGELYRISSLQFDLRPFSSPIRVRRHRVTRALSIVALEGGREAFFVDPRTGSPTLEPAEPFAPAEWDVVLEPGTPALDMHIPANTFVTLRSVAHSIRDGFEFFRKLSRPEVPVGACGEAWLLDPQVRALLPRNKGLHAVQRACSLFPSSLPEAKTVRRLFGPDVSREDLRRWPRDEMNTLQRSLADFLADDTHHLAARGGFILAEELDQLPVWGPVEAT